MAEHSTMHTTALTTNSYLSPNINRAKVDKLLSRLSLQFHRSTFSPISCSLVDLGFRINPEIGWGKSSDFVLFLKNHFGSSSFFVFPYKF